MKKVLKWIAGLLVLAIIMWWVWSFFKPKEAVSYLTEEVKRGNISQTVSATGEIASSHLVEVGAQASGQIRKLHVKLGQKIKQGDLIGHQGNYSGDPNNPTGLHLHLSIVKDDGEGHYMNETRLQNVYDPSPWFGFPLSGKEAPTTPPACPNKR